MLITIKFRNAEHNEGDFFFLLQAFSQADTGVGGVRLLMRLSVNEHVERVIDNFRRVS